MVYFFNKTIKNVLSNYIPHGTITCDDRDPAWINKTIKQLIQKINNACRSYILSKKSSQMSEKVKYLQNQLKLLTESNRERYHLRISKRLTNPVASVKKLMVNIKELPNNYVALELPLFDPPTLHYHASSRMIRRPPLRYVRPDTDIPLYHLFLFFEVKKNRYAPTHDTTTRFLATKSNCQV